jgi:hypothetical protein
MESNWIAQRKLTARVWTAAAFAVLGAVALWLGAQSVTMQLLLAAAVAVVAGTLAIVLQFRSQAASRMLETLDAYAEREMARARRSRAAKKTRAFSSPVGNGQHRGASVARIAKEKGEDQ